MSCETPITRPHWSLRPVVFVLGELPNWILLALGASSTLIIAVVRPDQVMALPATTMIFAAGMLNLRALRWRPTVLATQAEKDQETAIYWAAVTFDFLLIWAALGLIATTNRRFPISGELLPIAGCCSILTALVWSRVAADERLRFSLRQLVTFTVGLSVLLGVGKLIVSQ